jgi:NAD(P)-dependent dehydrogenase (short-subunit alcohol dehydrogenase family)
MNDTRPVALVQGANRGIGLAFVQALIERGYRVIGTCRSPSDATSLHALQVPVVRLDLEKESTIAGAAEEVGAVTDRIDLLLNVAGVLHGPDFNPEKRIEHLEPDAMHKVFAVNAFGPALVAKHFLSLLTHADRAVLANLSARVGSIGDNRIGGWYTYRASKAAQNQFTRTLAIEAKRRARKLIVVGLHPGTVDTELSEPFQRNVPEGKLFTAARAANQLLDVIDGLKPDDSGRFFAWDGEPIPW